MSLADLPIAGTGTIVRVGGERGFRRRLLEMGITPGARVRVLNVSPLGDPIEIEVRRSRMSLRRREAGMISVRP